MKHPLRPKTLRARTLRGNATDADLLGRALRESLPLRFRRQRPIGPYIVDFACPAKKLIIELDGGQHAEQQDEDARRSAELGRYGYRVIRFWNNDVLTNLNGVLDVIRRPKSFSALKGGEGLPPKRRS